MKFKLKDGKNSVREFTINDVNYHPGDIVDLPQTYEGEKWLIRVDPVPAVTAPPQKITSVNVAAPTIVEPVKVEAKPLAQTVQKVEDPKTAAATPEWGASKKKTTA